MNPRILKLISTSIFFTFLVIPRISAAGTISFVSGELFFVSNRAGSDIYEISSGGDLTTVLPFARGGMQTERSLGQATWSPDLTKMYTTNFSGNSVYEVLPDGTSRQYASVKDPMGIVTTNNGRILVLSFGVPSIVYDISEPSNVTKFAELPYLSRNMTALPTGEILVASSFGTVFDISSGVAEVYAQISDSRNGYLGDIDYDNNGNVYVTGGFGSYNNIYNITGGGTFDVNDIFSSIINEGIGGAFGLAINKITNQILLAPLGRNYVLDISTGGEIDATMQSNHFAFNIPTTSDMAMDFVPFPKITTVPLPSSVALIIIGLALITLKLRLTTSKKASGR